METRRYLPVPLSDLFGREKEIDEAALSRIERVPGDKIATLRMVAVDTGNGGRHIVAAFLPQPGRQRRQMVAKSR